MYLHLDIVSSYDHIFSNIFSHLASHSINIIKSYILLRLSF